MIIDRDLAAGALPAYEVGGELGRGGWGAVLAGRHRQLQREVAIKQLPRAFAAAPHVRARFVAEAQLLASLDHPHIVPVYDFVDANGLCLLVMEQLTGGSVWSRFVDDGFTTEQACEVVLATCSALNYAHGQGILHRDVKPENIMFSARGVLKVTDFGIAKVLGGSEHLMTRAGEVLGTPAYMAPEQAQAGELSPATDVYATGVLLYELLSGQLPYSDEGDSLALLYRHVHEDARPIHQVAPNVPDQLADTVMCALQRDPRDRYPSASAFAAAIAEASERLTAPSTVLSPVPTGPARTGAPSTIIDEPVPTQGPVRPTAVVHTRGVWADEVAATDVVPVYRRLPRPAFPLAELVAVLALVASICGVAFSGWDAPATGGNFAAGELVLRQSEADGALDLAEPVVLVGGPGIDITGARVDLVVAGIQLASSEGQTEVQPDGSSVTTLDFSGARYFVAGETAAEVSLLDGRHQVLTIEPQQNRLLTVPGATGVVAMLFVAAYAESLLRSLRHGRKRFSANLGLILLGPVAGVAAADLAWLAGRPSSLVSATTCAVLGGLLGFALARFGRRLAK